MNVKTLEGFLREHTGLAFPPSRRDALDEGVNRIMERAAVHDSTAFLNRLRTDALLLDELIAAITISETHFFRHREQLAVIRDMALAAIASNGAEPIRVWSAGCSSGEEPYSLAIMLAEAGLLDRVSIAATDISRAALKKARTARYRRWSFRGFEPADSPHFQPIAPTEYEVASHIQRSVAFRHHNLAKDRYPSLGAGLWHMDLIVCRNVLIYFDRATIERVAHQLLATLNPDGWLFLGAADPVLAEFAPCRVVTTPAGLAYRRIVADPASTQYRWHAAESTPANAPQRESKPLPCTEAARPSAPDVDELRALVREAYDRADYGEAARLAAAIPPAECGAAEWGLLVRALANAGRLEDAGAACLRSLERFETEPELTYLHALLLAAADRYQDAAEAARRALYLDREFVMAHLLLGSALARLGEHTKAARAFDNARTLLDELPPDTMLRATDGVPASQLLAFVHAQLDMLEEDAA